MSLENLLTTNEITESIDASSGSIEQVIWHFQYTFFKGAASQVLEKLRKIKAGLEDSLSLDLIYAYEALAKYYDRRKEIDFEKNHREVYVILKMISELRGRELDPLTGVMLKNQAALSLKNIGRAEEAERLFREAGKDGLGIVAKTKRMGDSKEKLRHQLAHEWVGYTAFNLARNPDFRMGDTKRRSLYEKSISSMGKAYSSGKKFYDSPDHIKGQIEKIRVEYSIRFFCQIREETKSDYEFVRYLRNSLRGLRIASRGQAGHRQRDYHIYTLEVHKLLEDAKITSPFNVRHHAQKANEIDEGLKFGTIMREEQKALVGRYLAK